MSTNNLKDVEALDTKELDETPIELTEDQSRRQSTDLENIQTSNDGYEALNDAEEGDLENAAFADESASEARNASEAGNFDQDARKEGLDSGSQANLVAKKEEDSMNVILDETLGSIEADILQNEEEYQQIGETDVPQSAVNEAAVSNDHIHENLARLLETPEPEPKDTNFPFPHATYEADPDEFTVGLVLSLSRSASKEDVSQTDTDIAEIRPSSPTFMAQGTENAVDAQAQVNENGVADPSNPSDVSENQAEVTPEVSLPPPPPEEIINRDEIIAQLRQKLELKEKLTQKNLLLQNKLGDYFKKKRTEDIRDNEKSVADQEQRYAACMVSLNELKSEFNAASVSNQNIMSEYKAKLEEKSADANSKYTEFADFKRTTALSSENSRTGKSLSDKIVEQLEATDLKKENEVVGVRLENIKLRNKLRRHEQLLRQKEELADGLHLIDFEQLKIENQTYNEKIEERNEELLKLRKKITNVVQVLTHVKEKLQFVQGENIQLKQELKQLDEDVTSRRDSLPQAKHARDKLRNTNTLLREKNGLLGNDNLLRDFGEKMDESKLLHTQIDDLQKSFTDLTNETQRLKRKMQKVELVKKLTNPAEISVAF